VQRFNKKRRWPSCDKVVVQQSEMQPDLVNGLHGKVEGHELADGLEASHRCADGHASKALPMPQRTHVGRSPSGVALLSARGSGDADPRTISVMGVSMTRFSPNRSSKPLLTL